jgi:hypothetical protein
MKFSNPLSLDLIAAVFLHLWLQALSQRMRLTATW